MKKGAEHIVSLIHLPWEGVVLLTLHWNKPCSLLPLPPPAPITIWCGFHLVTCFLQEHAKLCQSECLFFIHQHIPSTWNIRWHKVSERGGRINMSALQHVYGWSNEERCISLGDKLMEMHFIKTAWISSFCTKINLSVHSIFHKPLQVPLNDSKTTYQFDSKCVDECTNEFCMSEFVIHPQNVEVSGISYQLSCW